MLPHLPLQEAFQLINVHLRDDGSRGDKHPEHGVDAVQRHAVQVSQHGLDVGPEQLQRGGGGSEVMQGLFVWLIIILNYMGALHKHDSISHSNFMYYLSYLFLHLTGTIMSLALFSISIL